MQKKNRYYQFCCICVLSSIVYKRNLVISHEYLLFKFGRKLLPKQAEKRGTGSFGFTFGFKCLELSWEILKWIVWGALRYGERGQEFPFDLFELYYYQLMCWKCIWFFIAKTCKHPKFTFRIIFLWKRFWPLLHFEGLSIIESNWRKAFDNWR